MRKCAITHEMVGGILMSKMNKEFNKQTDSERRTTLNLSVTVTDKQFLKIYAAEQGVTVAAVIHECITEYLAKKKK